MATVWQKVRSDKQFNPDHVNQILREKEQLKLFRELQLLQLVGQFVQEHCMFVKQLQVMGSVIYCYLAQDLLA